MDIELALFNCYYKLVNWHTTKKRQKNEYSNVFYFFNFHNSTSELFLG